MKAKPTHLDLQIEERKKREFTFSYHGDDLWLDFAVLYTNSGWEGIGERHVELFKQSIEVHHETGLTPRMLKEQRDELLSALRGVISANNGGLRIERDAAMDIAKLVYHKS